MKKNRIDYYRLLAILTIIGSILYFYANLFAPRLVPRSLRIGVVRRPMNILVVGTDLNYNIDTGKIMPGSEGRTDSIMLVGIDPIHYRVNILSIPRDSFVAIPGRGMQKINAAHVYGGIDLVKQTVTDLTGLKIDHYVEVNPFVTIKLVDLVGGVDLFVEKDMHYVDRAQSLYINLKQGRHKLLGKDAQGYIRFRHDDSGDIGRVERQQKFLQSLFASFARPTNLLKAPLALGVAAQYIKTDLPLLNIFRLLNFTRMLSPGDIKTFTAAGEVGNSDFAGSIWVLNRPELDRIVRDHFSK
jgi:LCP family protein required for cell wall assembly